MAAAARVDLSCRWVFTEWQVRLDTPLERDMLHGCVFLSFWGVGTITLGNWHGRVVFTGAASLTEHHAEKRILKVHLYPGY
jgi:hypothetical protein